MQMNSNMRFKFKWRVLALLLVSCYSITFLRFISFSSSEDAGDIAANPSRASHPNAADSNRLLHNASSGNADAVDSKYKAAGSNSNKDIGLNFAGKSAPAPSLLHQIASRVMVREDWQTVAVRHLYVYSAYLDPRRHAVIVIGMVEARRTGTTAKCALWYLGNPEKPQLTSAIISIVPDTRVAPYFAATIKCTLPDNKASPDYVSLYVRAAKLLQWQIEAVGNLLPVVNNGPRGLDSRSSDQEVPPKIDNNRANALGNKRDWFNIRTSEEGERTSEGDTRHHKFTVCVNPLYGDISYQQLVEFIEANSLFQADHFIFYNSSNSSDISPYLRYYTQQGLVSVHSWSLPSEIQDSTYEHGQLAALNDCVYRNMFKTKYLAVMDINEIIVPTNDRTWNELFEDKLLIKDINVTAGFSFHTVFFSDVAESVYSSHPVVQKYNVQSLLHTYRENKIHNHRDRSRIIVIPERVTQIGAHFVRKFMNSTFRTFDVPYSHALLFSYRKGARLSKKGAELSQKGEEPIKNDGEVNKREEFDNVIEETRMNTFAMRIISRISRVHASVTSEK